MKTVRSASHDAGGLTALAIVAAVIVLAAFVSRRDDGVAIRTAVVEPGMIRSLVSTNGKIEPVSNFEAHAPVYDQRATRSRQRRRPGKKGDNCLLSWMTPMHGPRRLAPDTTKNGAGRFECGPTRRESEEVLNLESQLAKANTDRDSAQHNLDTLKKLEQLGRGLGGRSARGGKYSCPS